jgi:hypothetical protein
MCQRKYAYLVFLVVIICGCRQSGKHRLLIRADSLMNDHTDSAYKILCGIDSSKISSDEDMAYYDLLITQVKYKKDQTVHTDLLTRSINYYKQHNNPDLLQRSYFYRGAVNEENKGSLKKSTFDYKRAEKLIEETNDTILDLRIYENLSVANYMDVLSAEALKYAKKELYLADKIKDKSWIISALSNVSSAMYINEEKDSAMIYSKRLESIIPKDTIDPYLAATYNNIAFSYIEKPFRNAKLAEHYLIQSLKCRYSDASYLLLSELYFDSGRKKTAFQMIDTLLKKNNTEISVAVYDDVSKFYERIGDYENAYTVRLKYEEVMDSIEDAIEADNLTELQMKYDNEVVKNKREEDRSQFLIILLSGTLFSSILFIILTWLLRKKNIRIRRYENLLKVTNDKIECLKSDNSKSIEEKSHELNDIIKSKQKIINKLNMKLMNVSDKTVYYTSILQSARRGLSTLFYIMRDEDVSQLGKKDREDFITCYKIIDSDFLDKLDHLDENKLTVQEELFCILYRMDKDSTKIKKILCMSDDAFRKTKSRTLKKLHIDLSLKAFCDKISIN